MSSNQFTNEQIREFVIAGHGNLPRVTQMFEEQPKLLNLAYEWRPGDNETALQGAAHVGNRAIAEYLLAQGAPLELCTAAMLGMRAEVERFLQRDASAINATGAHAIPLLTHAALSGDVALVESLYQRGATTGAPLALSLAVSRGDVDMTRWLLEHAAPDLSWKNFQEKTALEIARENAQKNVDESNFRMIEELLRQHGATG